eukprot:Lithocolla_globosa_v1_NODE_10508_length_592_cov_2.333333.p1 type:complete len:114 gc:universal NODE_10508_length_592_cov_2.333333:459-118(-)
MYGQITQEELNELKNYKYCGKVTSPVDRYIMTPYWNAATELFPTWMAPNLITFIGLSFTFCNALLVMFYIPDLKGPAPAWVYFACATGKVIIRRRGEERRRGRREGEEEERRG